MSCLEIERLAVPASAATSAHVENSEVLPFESVAVAVMKEPAGTVAALKLTSKFVSPEPTPNDETPIGVWPSPLPDGSHAAFA